ncbi:MAG: phosphatidate cytidylyltransferase [Woeseiaceae bacterium]|nr:phosphatidate cytidylyltransferase [Woeseiaceae bacterium]
MLKARIITAVIAVSVLALVLFVVPEIAAELFIAGIIVAGAWEWSRFLGISTGLSRALFVFAIAALMALVNVYFTEENTRLLLQSALVWWLLALIWTFVFPTPIPVFLRWLCGALVLVPMYAALVLLYHADPLLLAFALLLVWAADIGAYFAGKRFGKVKLAPAISPGKTWEGVIGGLLLVVLLSVVWSLGFETNLMVLVPFCMAVAGLSIVGDLTVSMFKRTSGVKDSGKLFPGHGGMLDRIDSLAAAAPLFALGLGWTGLV